MEATILKHNNKKYGGYSKCPTWLKQAYLKAVNYTCQDCNKHESEVGKLEAHRIKRGCEGGLYTCLPLNHPLSNVKILCHNCHDKYNYSKRNNYENSSKSQVIYK